MKKIFSVMILFIFVIAFSVTIFAEEPEVERWYNHAVLYTDGTFEVTDNNFSTLIIIPWEGEKSLITKVIFKNDTNITAIPKYAFNNCRNLTEIIIPASVTSIDERAFSECKNLSSVVFEANSSLESIGNAAFNGCDVLASITIPSSVTSIGERAFNECENLSSVVFEANSSLESIGNYAFNDCDSLTSITIPGSVKSIGNNAFNQCDALTSITIPSSVTAIGERAFSDCKNLSSVVFEANSNLESIGTYAFNDCDSLTSITIPDSVESIGNNAFNHCDALTSITIPGSVKSIGNNAFNQCDALTEINYLGGIEEWNLMTIGNNAIPSDVKIIHAGSCGDNDNDRFCDICGKELAHDFGTDWKFNDTHHWYECACGTRESENTHSGGIATCAAKARCSVCTQEYGAVDPDNHADYIIINDKKETCTAEGYTGDKYCEDCKNIFEQGTAIPVSSHNYSEWKVLYDSTENSPGRKVKTCSVCADKIYASIPEKSIIKIDLTVREEDETNPNTGAPVFAFPMLGIALLAAATVKKHR